MTCLHLTMLQSRWIKVMTDHTNGNQTEPASCFSAFSSPACRHTDVTPFWNLQVSCHNSTLLLCASVMDLTVAQSYHQLNSQAKGLNWKDWIRTTSQERPCLVLGWTKQRSALKPWCYIAHPLKNVLVKQSSVRGLFNSTAKKNQSRRSFLHTAVTLHND